MAIATVLRRDLIVRAARRARASDSPWARRLFDWVRWTYRFIGRTVPALHLGWTSQLRQVWWSDDGALCIRGWAYTRGTGYVQPPQVEVWLHRRLSLRRIRATVTSVVDPEARAARAAEFDYANTAFEASWDPSQLERLSRHSAAQVRIQVTGANRRYWGPFRRRHPFGSAIATRLRRDSEQHLIGPQWHDRRGLVVVRHPIGTSATAVRAEGRTLEVIVDQDVRHATLVGHGQDDVVLTVESAPGGSRLVGTLPDRVPVVDERSGRSIAASWGIRVRTGRGTDLVCLSDELGARPGPGSHLLVRSDGMSRLEVIDVPAFVEVDAASFPSDDMFRMEGTMVGTLDSLELAASRSAIPVEVVERNGTRFVAEAHLRVSAWDGPKLPPMSGGYALEARYGDEKIPTFVDEQLAAQLPLGKDTPEYQLSIGLEWRDQLRLRVHRPRRPDEFGSFNQIALQRTFNSSAQPRDAVYLESFFGRNATCNPRAIDAEIARRHPELPRFWGVSDLSIAVPEGATPVVVGTTEWWRARSTSRWVVTNEWLGARFRKQSFQTVLQTWHGSMYKKIGLDRDMSRRHKRLLLQERNSWDMFISQNVPGTEIIQSAYAFEAEDILEIGYPRNDELHAVDEERRQAVRRRLGVPDDVRLAMYAPTWRPVGADGTEAVLVDLPQLVEDLGPGWMLLLRGHVRTLDRSEAVDSQGILDVGTYPQVSDLFMVADLLITDYSSMMFDFSVTGKPMVFFAPDIDQYTDDRVRGTYFDLEALAPGPVVRTQDELRETLSGGMEWHAAYAEKYGEWQKMFNQFDDGSSASRATDALFKAHRPS